MFSVLQKFQLFLSLFFVLFTSCENGMMKGVLHITSPSAGTYEVYSIVGDSTLQYISEHVGHYNEDLTLSIGSYLILADCSHRTVTILPGEKYSFVAHAVNFIPPHVPGEDDLFSIQCSRYDKSHLKQQISNRFSFHMISGAKDLLVGMLPLTIDFPEYPIEGSPTTISYNLAALQVAPWYEQGLDETPYFVSPQHELLSITQAQESGKWQYLLPGKYIVHLNGTLMDVDLSEKESRVIEPAGLEISAGNEVNLNLFTQIRGNPFNVELNDFHSLDINTFYSVLPGQAKMRLDGSNETHMMDLKTKEITKFFIKSVHVDLGCSPWEWECLGKQEVNLYHPDEHYPFLESITDVPILFGDSKVEISLEGSKGVRYRLPKKRKHSKLYVGKVKIFAKPTYKTGHITDLLRLEAVGDDYVGHSHDINPDRPITMTLIAGTYHLSRYTVVVPENERLVQRFLIRIKAGETSSIEIPYYMSEAKAKIKEKEFLQSKKEAAIKLERIKEKQRPLISG